MNKKLSILLIAFFILFGFCVISFADDYYECDHVYDENGYGNSANGQVHGMATSDYRAEATGTVYNINVEGEIVNLILPAGQTIPGSDVVKGYNSMSTGENSVPQGTVTMTQSDVEAALRAAGRDDLADSLAHDKEDNKYIMNVQQGIYMTEPGSNTYRWYSMEEINNMVANGDEKLAYDMYTPIKNGNEAWYDDNNQKGSATYSKENKKTTQTIIPTLSGDIIPTSSGDIIPTSSGDIIPTSTPRPTPTPPPSTPPTTISPTPTPPPTTPPPPPPPSTPPTTISPTPTPPPSSLPKLESKFEITSNSVNQLKYEDTVTTLPIVTLEDEFTATVTISGDLNYYNSSNINDFIMLVTIDCKVCDEKYYTTEFIDNAYSHTCTVPITKKDNEKYEIISTVVAIDEKGFSYYLQNTKKIYVVGKIYDLEVRTVDDPSWKLKEAEKLAKLPIGEFEDNAILSYKYGVKLGYRVYFDLKTLRTSN